MRREQMTRWRRFDRTDHEKASRIRDLAIIATPLLHNQKPDKQVSILNQNDECRELLELLRQNRDTLALQDSGYAYVAFILGLVYCTIMKTDGRRIQP